MRGAAAQVRLPAPSTSYDARNEAELRRQLETMIAAQQAQIAELERRITAAGIA